ncbi:hypothetical protein ACIRPX_02495 [Streptomyces sp. NPDC101225]|uniref:hypothetical protein n=1 Tax=Streptomyces sp. NPDC101225 TaxID=3366135 RepID=UPI0037F91654
MVVDHATPPTARGTGLPASLTPDRIHRLASRVAATPSRSPSPTSASINWPLQRHGRPTNAKENA